MYDNIIDLISMVIDKYHSFSVYPFDDFHMIFLPTSILEQLNIISTTYTPDETKLSLFTTKLMEYYGDIFRYVQYYIDKLSIDEKEWFERDDITFATQVMLYLLTKDEERDHYKTEYESMELILLHKDLLIKPEPVLEPEVQAIVDNDGNQPEATGEVVEEVKEENPVLDKQVQDQELNALLNDVLKEGLENE